MAKESAVAGLRLGSMGLLFLGLLIVDASVLNGQHAPLWGYWRVIVLGVICFMLLPLAAALLWVGWLDWKRRPQTQNG